MQQHKHEEHRASHGGHYARLAVMALLSYLAMYALMYAMVNTFDNVFNNLNQAYMAGLMAAPMVVIEVVLMGRMYPYKRLNALLIVGSAIAAVCFWTAIRQQAAISDQQFLRSMIPHHAGAILMCRRNQLQDPELQELCRQIVSSQQAEIDLMKSKLDVRSAKQAISYSGQSHAAELDHDPDADPGRRPRDGEVSPGSLGMPGS